MARVAILLAMISATAATADARQRAPMRFGTSSSSDPYSGTMASIDNLQNALQRRISIVHWYQSWGGGDWTSTAHQPLFRTVRASGRAPLLTWEPMDARNPSPEQRDFRLRRIARGMFDNYINAWARQLRDLHQRVYLRPMHEMNGNWYPWAGTVNGNSPKTFKRAWRRIHRLFTRRGARNVRFVWSVNARDVPSTRRNRMERYYPGRRYVDVLGIDGYNWGTSVPGYGDWRSFHQIFWGPYKRLRRLGRQPIWITEVGSAEVGGDKGAWVRDMFSTVWRWKRVRAVVWFDENKERDWRMTSSPSAAEAFFTRPKAG